MKHYVLHIRGWVIPNANVPIDMNSTSEVRRYQINFFLPYKCPYIKELWLEPTATYLSFQCLNRQDIFSSKHIIDNSRAMAVSPTCVPRPPHKHACGATLCTRTENIPRTSAQLTTQLCIQQAACTWCGDSPAAEDTIRPAETRARASLSWASARRVFHHHYVHSDEKYFIVSTQYFHAN